MPTIKASRQARNTDSQSPTGLLDIRACLSYAADRERGVLIAA
jgi:hypothetical protein